MAGMITAPSFITASTISHSSTWLPSITITSVAAPDALRRSQLATWFVRAASSLNVHCCSEPSSSTIRSATWSPRVGTGPEGVEPVQGPVELGRLRPPELRLRLVIVGAKLEQQIAGGR